MLCKLVLLYTASSSSCKNLSMDLSMDLSMSLSYSCYFLGSSLDCRCRFSFDSVFMITPLFGLVTCRTGYGAVSGLCLNSLWCLFSLLGLYSFGFPRSPCIMPARACWTVSSTALRLYCGSWPLGLLLGLFLHGRPPPHLGLEVCFCFHCGPPLMPAPIPWGKFAHYNCIHH